MLCEALRLVRIYHDKSQSEMAGILGVSKSYLSEVESGKKRVTLGLLEKYGEVLNIPVSSLMFFSEEISTDGKPKKRQIAVSEKIISFLKLLANEGNENANGKDKELPN